MEWVSWFSKGTPSRPNFTATCFLISYATCFSPKGHCPNWSTSYWLDWALNSFGYVQKWNPLQRKNVTTELFITMGIRSEANIPKKEFQRGLELSRSTGIWTKWLWLFVPAALQCNVYLLLAPAPPQLPCILQTNGFSRWCCPILRGTPILQIHYIYVEVGRSQFFHCFLGVACSQRTTS